MFSGPNRLPTELILRTLSNLSAKDTISFLSTTKEFRSFIKDDYIWKKFGANNFEDFIKRMKKLPEYFQRLVLTQPNYPLTLAEDIIRIQKLPETEKINALFITASEKELLKKIPSYLESTLTSDNGVILFCEKLITLKEIDDLSRMTYHKAILLTISADENAIILFREKHITPGKLFTFPQETIEALLKNEECLAAVRQNKISAAEALYGLYQNMSLDQIIKNVNTPRNKPF